MSSRMSGEVISKTTVQLFKYFICRLNEMLMEPKCHLRLNIQLCKV